MRLLLAATVVLALASGALAAAPRVVQGDSSVGGLAVGRGTLAQARARFGAPTSAAAHGETCTATWKRLGLRISFLDFAGKPCTRGGAVVLRISDRAHWRTGRGLRVGDSAARLRALYSKAKLHPDGYWLIPRRSCKETGAQPFAGLLALIRAGHVRALLVTAGVCE